MENSISIKGTREGLTITLGSGDVRGILHELTQHLKTKGAFFRGGRVALKVGDRAIEQGEMSAISALLAEHQMILRTVVTTDRTTQQSAKALGLRLVVEGPLPEQATQEADGPAPVAASPTASSSGESRGLLIRRRCRSGQVIRHTGHVVVIGDVNVGAEISAGGDIVVWGRLQGTAHAGFMGNREAVVCALDLSPLQLRIGDLVARPGENEHAGGPSPEMASVRDERIVVERWDRT